MIVILAAAAALAAQGPGAFIERLYANYHRPDYSPLDHPRRTFAEPLAAAIAEDQRLARGEVGYLDGDPLCDCQDSEGLRARIAELRTTGRSATVHVLIRFASSTDRRDLTLMLVQTGAGWRLADVRSASQPSLLRALEASNRKGRKGH